MGAPFLYVRAEMAVCSRCCGLLACVGVWWVPNAGRRVALELVLVALELALVAMRNVMVVYKLN